MQSLLFAPIFQALEDAGVRYLVVGGLATIAHGYVRLTGDVDLIVHLEPENARKAIEALTRLGFAPRAPVDPLDFADPAKRRNWVESKGLTVFSMYSRSGLPLEVDLFVEEPMPFETLWKKREQRTIGSATMQVIDPESLIELKRRSGRPQDLSDIAELERLRDE